MDQPATFSNHPSSKFTKVLLIGDSGAGKTGALASLVGAGYSLRILDCDNGIDALYKIVKRDYPDRLDQMEYVTVRDEYKASSNGPVMVGPPVFGKALTFLDTWNGSKPSVWGEKTVFVLDSLSFFGEMALNWAKSHNPTFRDARLWYGTAQEALKKVIAQLSSSSFETNVVIISHIDYQELGDGISTPKLIKGFPKAIGRSLGVTLATYFNSVLLVENSGAKRTIKTKSTPIVDVKNAALFNLASALPIETGLADFFAEVRK